MSVVYENIPVCVSARLADGDSRRRPLRMVYGSNTRWAWADRRETSGV